METSPGMTDFIIVVPDAYQFHRENISNNPTHYSGLTSFLSSDPARRASVWQNYNIQSTLLTNPGLSFHLTENVKYGVIQRDFMMDDLRNWTYLYTSGRLHKPVVSLIERDEELVEAQEQINLPSALATALLLALPLMSAHGSVPLASLYSQIAGISYTGDIRLAAGAEDPRKIEKLVHSPGQIQRFDRLYEPSLQSLSRRGLLSLSEKDRKVSWDVDGITQFPFPTKRLPTRSVLEQRVARATRFQSAKGVLTAGVSTSAAYALRKLMKGWKSVLLA